MVDSLNIFITGGAGYLGSIMVPSLIRDGHKVTVLDSFLFDQNTSGFKTKELIRVANLSPNKN